MIVKAWRKKMLKRISYLLVVPISRLYLNSERKTIIENISMIIRPGVFHPSMFFSTKFLLQWLKKQSLNNVRVLELGAGSGLLSIYSAKQKAIVTATDISQQACLCIEENILLNKVNIKVYQSDLFMDIPWQQFDLILINPPYYPKNPVAENEYAWYCGEEFEYFEKLFFQIGRYMSNNSKTIMILSEDCNIDRIKSIALKNKFNWKLIVEKKIFFEENYLFEITLKE